MNERPLPASLPPEPEQATQAELFALLARQTVLYTAGDSSSVPVEVAEELMRSIVFTLSLGGNAGGAAARLAAGQHALALLMEDCDRLLRGLAAAPPPRTNQAYRDTLASMTGYRKRYDRLFFAHVVPADIDYPLAWAVEEQVQGICYLKEYLRRMALENRLLRLFGAAETEALLAGCGPDPDAMSLNLYEPVAAAALALTLLHEDPAPLHVTDEGRAALLRRFTAYDGGALNHALAAAADTLADRCALNEPDDRAYLRRAALALAPRINAALSAGRLDGVFPSPLCDAPKLSPVWVDGAPMPDEALRGLIAALGECRFLSDKAALVTRSVHALRDLTEVLDLCFWGEECDALFDWYGPHACLALLQAVQQKPDGWASETGWERRLRRYLLHHLRR